MPVLLFLWLHDLFMEILFIKDAEVIHKQE